MDSKVEILDSFNYTDGGCDMIDAGRQFECQNASLQAKGRAGDKQQVCLHWLYEGTVVHDAQLSAWPVKITDIYLMNCSEVQEPECSQ